MKRLITLFVILAVAAQPALCRSRYSKTKLITGLLLGTIGTLVAVDGFSMVKENISRPSSSVTITDFNTHEDTAPDVQWSANSGGTLTNTGNVRFDTVTVRVTYHDAQGSPLVADGNFPEYYRTDPVAPGEQIAWAVDDSHFMMTGEPRDPTAEVTYTYTPLKRVTMKNQTQGAVGVAMTGVGLYLVIDSITSANKVDYFLKKHDMDIRVANKGLEHFGLVVSKRI